MKSASRFPSWLKKTVHLNSDINITKVVLKEFNINTACQSARCPNIFDCFSKRRTTFLILGDVCARNCGFCAVRKGQPNLTDEDEPGKVAEAAFRLGLRHIVITSVTRDDLIDGGSAQFADTVLTVRKRFNRDVQIEVLVPDFKGDAVNIQRVVDAGPDIFGHNIETVPRLYRSLRPGADYEESLEVLRFAKRLRPNLNTKSAFMLGLGETEEETISVMKDLISVNCDMLAVGQYLRPSPEQVEVVDFIRPEKFLMLREIGYSLGFKNVQSGPFIRSSYKEDL